MNPANKILEHNKEHNLQFNEKDHIYTILDGIKLDSVTTKLKDFFPFDAKKVAEELAERRGTHAALILEEWRKIRDNGTYTHLLAEKICNGDKLCAEELEKAKHVVQFLKDHPNFQILDSEVRVFSKKYNIAGTVDLMLLNKENNKLYLLDWKTSNKEIEKDEHWSMAQGILNELPHNKFYQYSMQVAIYSFILKEEYSIEIYDSLLVHLRNDQTYKVIEPTDL
ncbi:MAG: PD-(D/E)XK nuclease family protein, partial [Nanoarchaeota archaeon]|nr:PD-(D/E)XK nuclease family protein [Nanoarchaeota archaeon]